VWGDHVTLAPPLINCRPSARDRRVAPDELARPPHDDRHRGWISRLKSRDRAKNPPSPGCPVPHVTGPSSVDRRVSRDHDHVSRAPIASADARTPRNNNHQLVLAASAPFDSPLSPPPPAPASTPVNPVSSPSYRKHQIIPLTFLNRPLPRPPRPYPLSNRNPSIPYVLYYPLFSI